MSEPRVDLRIPSELYERIEKIAIATNQPATPKSKNTTNPKPVLTPVIIKLIELGLSQIDETQLESLENDNKEITLKPTNQIEVEEIEKKILDTLLLKLEGIVSDKVEEILDRKLTQPSPNESEFTFVDTVEEIRKLNSQGLNYAQIAKKLTDAKYPTKQGKFNWTGIQVSRILEKI